jgi:selenoprotein W-related protein
MELIPTTGGAFEVYVNDDKIYSKLELGKFPEPSEIIEHLSR